MSAYTGSWMELLYASVKPGTSHNTFTSEVVANDVTGMGAQAFLPPNFWLPNAGSVGRGIRIMARFIISSTATPTFTFTTRLGAAASTSASIILGSAALTTVSGASSAIVEMEGDIILETLGGAGANSTVRGLGQINSPGLNPACANLFGGGATPGTVATIDTTITNNINVNVACGTSNASNVAQLLQLLVWGLN